MEKTCSTCDWRNRPVTVCNKCKNLDKWEQLPQEPSPKSEDVQHTEYAAYVEGYDRCNACGVYFRPNTRHKCSHTVRPKSESVMDSKPKFTCTKCGKEVRTLYTSYQICKDCVDKKEPKSERMEGVDWKDVFNTCAFCIHWNKCSSLICSLKPASKCDFSPSRHTLNSYGEFIYIKIRPLIEKEVRQRVVEEILHNAKTKYYQDERLLRYVELLLTLSAKGE